MNRKGVSQIVAALLLVALAVAAAILLYVYAMGYMGQLQTSGGQQMKEQLVLEAYNWQSTNVLVLTVRNVGPTPINLASADFFMNGQASTWTMNCPSGLQPSQSCVISLTIPNAQQGTAYPVKIVTADGATFSYSAVCGSTG